MNSDGRVRKCSRGNTSRQLYRLPRPQITLTAVFCNLKTRLKEDDDEELIKQIRGKSGQNKVDVTDNSEVTDWILTCAISKLDPKSDILDQSITNALSTYARKFFISDY
ncbi:hypothetical protein J6590_096132 [Homalodisca vitripennis]|nr:hypothetical protein J6590_096132 [Homalodisca vitripennis]